MLFQQAKLNKECLSCIQGISQSFFNTVLKMNMFLFQYLFETCLPNWIESCGFSISTSLNWTKGFVTHVRPLISSFLRSSSTATYFLALAEILTKNLISLCLKYPASLLLNPRKKCPQSFILKDKMSEFKGKDNTVPIFRKFGSSSMLSFHTSYKNEKEEWKAFLLIQEYAF